MLTDVLIIGAGPAGCLAAYYLSKAGVKTTILEKKKHPRQKPCAGGLPLKTQNEIPFNISPVVEKFAQGGFLTNKGTQVLDKDFLKPLAALVTREKFDQFLAEKALEQGAELYENSPLLKIEMHHGFVVAITKTRTYKSKYLIGADGVNSLTAKSLGLLSNRNVGYALEARVKVNQEELEKQGSYVTFDFGIVKNGYAWIFPKQDHLSIGVCNAVTSKKTNLRAYLDLFINSQSVLKNCTISKIVAHPVPLGGNYSVLHKENCILIGDAANLADAWLGEGLFYAARSAKIAAECILEAMHSDLQQLSLYTSRINQEIITELQAAKKIGNLVYTYPGLANKLIKNNSNLQQKVIDTICGSSSHQELVTYIKSNWVKILSKGILPNHKKIKAH